MKFPSWENSRVIPFECFLPPTTLFFLVCSPLWILPVYQKTAAFQQQEQQQQKNSHVHKTREYFKENQNNQGHPSLQATTQQRWAPGLTWTWCPGPVWDEHRVHCWLLQVLWTATKHWHNGEGSIANWNRACSQSGLGSQPLFYSGSFKTC